MPQPKSQISKKWNLDQLNKALAGLTEYIDQLEAKADGVTGKIMPVQQLGGAFGRFSTNIDTYEKQGFYKHSWRTAADKAEAQFTSTMAQVDKQHQENLIAIANNVQIKDSVNLMMHNIGIPLTYQVIDRKSRSRLPKYVEQKAGYIGDLYRNCPTSDGYESAVQAYDKLMRSVVEYRKACSELEETERRVKEQQATKEKNARTLATLVVKHGLPHDTDAHGVLAHLTASNQLLNLAHAMRMTRNDWSEGFWRVSDAIAAFVPASGIDDEILHDVASYLDGEESDGRCFRDCKWSYNDILHRLSESQNNGLVADYHAICEVLGV